jgi:hypothetical protein
MWITGLCAFWPPIPDTEISIRDTGLVLDKDFSAPVSKSYLFTLRFVFPSTEARLRDELVGDGHTSGVCTSNIDYDTIPERERPGLGLPIPFKVVVRAEPGGTSVAEQTYHSLCKMGHMTNDKFRDIGRLYLNEGTYRVEVYNLQPQPAFDGISVRSAFGRRAEVEFRGRQVR